MTTKATACSRTGAHRTCRLRGHRAWRATPRRSHRAYETRPQCADSPAGVLPARTQHEIHDIVVESVRRLHGQDGSRNQRSRPDATATGSPGSRGSIPPFQPGTRPTWPARRDQLTSTEAVPPGDAEGPAGGEHGDLDVLLVRRRAEPENVQEPADEQEGDRTAHMAGARPLHGCPAPAAGLARLWPRRQRRRPPPLPPRSGIAGSLTDTG